MNSKLSVLLLCLGLGQIIGLSINHKAHQLMHLSVDHHVKIQRLEMESDMLAETHQETSTTCFSYYRPIFNTISDQYEINFDACINAFTNASAAIDAKYAPARQDFQNTISGSCQTLNACSVNTTQARNAFDCIAANAAEISKSFYSISANATEIGAKIEEDYRVIDTQKAICVNDAEWNYVEATADTYEELNACLRGDINTPKSSTTTTTTTTTTYSPRTTW